MWPGLVLKAPASGGGPRTGTSTSSSAPGAPLAAGSAAAAASTGVGGCAGPGAAANAPGSSTGNTTGHEAAAAAGGAGSAPGSTSCSGAADAAFAAGFTPAAAAGADASQAEDSDLEAAVDGFEALLQQLSGAGCTGCCHACSLRPRAGCPPLPHAGRGACDTWCACHLAGWRTVGKVDKAWARTPHHALQARVSGWPSSRTTSGDPRPRRSRSASPRCWAAARTTAATDAWAPRAMTAGLMRAAHSGAHTHVACKPPHARWLRSHARWLRSHAGMLHAATPGCTPGPVRPPHLSRASPNPPQPGCSWDYTQPGDTPRQGASGGAHNACLLCGCRRSIPIVAGRRAISGITQHRVRVRQQEPSSACARAPLRAPGNTAGAL